MTRCVGAGLGLALALFGAATQSPGEDQSLKQVVAAGRLWTLVGYFHPTLDSLGVDWDEALVSTLPRLRAATTSEAYAAAVNDMLTRIGDPATRVLSASGAEGASGLGFASIELTADRILVARTGRTPGDPLATAEEFHRMLARADAVVLDLTAGAAHPWLLNPALLTAKPLVLPGVRWRVQSGAHPDRGGWASPYFSASLVRDGPVIAPAAASQVPVVFVVADEQQVPELATALQDAGSGYLISTRPVTGAHLHCHRGNYDCSRRFASGAYSSISSPTGIS